MDLEFYVRVRTCKKRVTGKQPLIIVSVCMCIVYYIYVYVVYVCDGCCFCNMRFLFKICKLHVYLNCMVFWDHSNWFKAVVIPCHNL